MRDLISLSVFLLFIGSWLSACDVSDPSSQDFSVLQPVWTLEFDESDQTLQAEASVLAPFSQTLQGSASESEAQSVALTFDNEADRIRLTGGDRLRIQSAGNSSQDSSQGSSNNTSWLLYRRDEPFVYQRTVRLPEGLRRLQLRFDTDDRRLDASVVALDLQVDVNPVLQQELQTVAVADDLQISWQQPQRPLVAGAEVTSQDVSLRQLSCDGVLQEGGQQPLRAIGLPLDTRELALPVANFVINRPGSSTGDDSNATTGPFNDCEYSIQVTLTYRTTAPVPVRISYVSRQLPFTVVF